MTDRGDPTTLFPAARALADGGASPREIVRAIYGVDLPAEAWLLEREVVYPTIRGLVDESDELDVMWGRLPWELMIPSDRGGPKDDIAPVLADLEAKIFRAAPDVIVLGSIGYRGSSVESSYVGYSLDELREGRATVMGCFKRTVTDGTPTFRIYGPSLLDVIRLGTAQHIDVLETMRRRGDADDEDVERVRAQLAQVDRLLAEAEGAEP